MSQKIKDESGTVGGRSAQNFYISNKSIETGMNMSIIHARMVKSVKINKE